MLFRIKYIMIDRSCRERDDAVSQLMSVRGQLQALRQREEAAYQQVKKSVEMAEQAQLEATAVRHNVKIAVCLILLVTTPCLCRVYMCLFSHRAWWLGSR